MSNFSGVIDLVPGAILLGISIVGIGALIAVGVQSFRMENAIGCEIVLNGDTTTVKDYTVFPEKLILTTGDTISWYESQEKLIK